MIVVSDTSPLNYLVLIGSEHILPALFGKILIPPAVHSELLRAETPAKVKEWVAQHPGWLSIQIPSIILPGLDLDVGETEAISLTLELGAHAILIDDRKARVVAQHQGLTLIGTITVLEMAAKRNLVALPEIFDKLQGTNFRASSQLLKDALERDRNSRL